jgi:chloramphenicol-sensitive protein RarD
MNLVNSSFRYGLAMGFGAYFIWGLFPLFWSVLEPAGAAEIVSHRIIWSMLFLLLIVTLSRSWRNVFNVIRNKRTALLLVAAAFFITANWVTYIWAVINERVVETSFGYFMNPLVSVLLGVVVLRESLRRSQWLAVGIAGIGVVIITIGVGNVPIVGLILAFSFAFYGLVRKIADVDAVTAQMVETLFLAPLALGVFAYLALTSNLAFGNEGFGKSTLLALAGVVTVVPLLAFGAAVVRIPLSTLGILQYLTPTMALLIGVFLFGENMPPARWAGFFAVWVALAIFTVDALKYNKTDQASAKSRANPVTDSN